MNPKPILICLLGAALVGIQEARATLGITNGNFETGAGNNLDNVDGWFDSSDGTFWHGTWQTNNAGVSPNNTGVAVLGSYESGAVQNTASASALGGNWLYQPIGTADGLTSLECRFQFGQPDDDGGGRTLGLTVAVYAFDGIGTFVAGDNVDLEAASLDSATTGITLLDSESFQFGPTTTADQVPTGLSSTLDISGAGSQTLFLRFNNYRPAATESWSVVDNVEIVADVPIFSIQPVDQFKSVGDTVTLNAAANSVPAPTYQWEYSQDGLDPWAELPEKMDASLVLDPAVSSDIGYYRVVATNSNSSTTSNTAQLDLSYPEPAIATQPEGGAVLLGSNVSLTVGATGIGSLSYQWYKQSTGILTNGGSVSGATTATLSLNNVQSATAGYYYCLVTDHAATEDSSGQADTFVYSAIVQLEVFTASATDLMSFEPFVSYPTGVELDGLDPAVDGYDSAWADVAFGDVVPTTSAGSLVYGGAGYAAGIGGKVGKVADAAGILPTNSGRAERFLAANLKGTALSSQTIYLSWLFKTGNEGAAVDANNYQILGLWNGDSGNDAMRMFEAGIALGDFGTANYGFRVGNTTSMDLTVAPDSNVHLFVVKFEFSSTDNSDNVTVWLDPALGAGEPTAVHTISGVNLSFDRLTLSDYASNSSYWDEIRWGTTFDSVSVEQPDVPLIPEYSLQPMDYYGEVGDVVNLSAAAVSNPEPTYQWEFSAVGFDPWTEVAEATDATLSLNPSVYSDNGYYRVVASNGNGDITSNEVLVDLIYPAPTIIQQPASAPTLAGSDVQISVTATGLGNLTYQWYKVDGGGDIEITGKTDAILELSGVTSGDQGDYYVIVTDDAAMVDVGYTTETPSATASVMIVDVLVSSSLTAPTTDSFDQFYLPGNVDDVDNIGGSPGGVPITTSGTNDASTYVAFDKTSQGMTFTTGSDPLGYSISKVTIRHVLWNTFLGNGTFYDLQYADTFEFQFGSISGSTKTPIFDSDTATYLGNAIAGGGDSGTGNYLTFDLSAAGIATLAPNTTYYFEIASETGDAYFELSGTTADAYAGGTAFRGQTGATVDGTYLALAGDRTFHVDLTGLSGPADDYATWISGYPVGGLTGFTDDADNDGIKNGLESFFGTDPSASNQGIVEVARNSNSLTFQHPQNSTLASDVSAVYVWSTDLESYHANGMSSGGTTVNFSASLDTPVVGTTSVTATMTGSAPAKLFVRLVATQTTP